MDDPAVKFAFALDGLIRSRTKGHGGEIYARKCIHEIAESLSALMQQKELQAIRDEMSRVLGLLQ